MPLKPLRFVPAMLVLAALAACDDDPTMPVANLAVSCPAAPLSVNAPISLSFSGRVAPGSITGANIVVTNAETGAEIPGSLTLTNTGTNATVAFDPSAALPFGTNVRIRVQNVLSDTTLVPFGLFVCERATQAAPITEVFFDQLPSATGNPLLGVSLVARDSGFLISEPGSAFRRRGNEFDVVFNQPYYGQGRDIAFVDQNEGFVSHTDFRINRSVINRTTDAGTNWVEIFQDTRIPISRLWFRRVNTATFGVAGGGGSAEALFYKYLPATTTFVRTTQDPTANNVNDIDFISTDTARGAAISQGSRFSTSQKLGQVWFTTNGGQSWAKIPNAQATQVQLTYEGVAIKGNGEIFAVGGSGYVVRLTPTTTGATTYTYARILPANINPAIPIVNPDSVDPQALIYTDVQFAPDNNQIGFLIGAVRIGVVNGRPQYQGLIFRTTDGGSTWIRQGVRGAEDYGASIPKLNRLSVLSSTQVWIAGDAGVVLSYNP